MRLNTIFILQKSFQRTSVKNLIIYKEINKYVSVKNETFINFKLINVSSELFIR